MDWLKYIFIFFLFYLFAMLQSSFFAHFSLFGAVPNFIFIFFFLIVFFTPKKMNYIILFYAIIAGLFLDIFSYTYFGASVVLLIIIGYLTKKMQASLKEKKDKYPFIYFLPIFLICLIIYELMLMLYFRFLDSSHTLMSIDWKFLAGIIYNLIVASLGFLIFKKINGKKIQS